MCTYIIYLPVIYILYLISYLHIYVFLENPNIIQQHKSALYFHCFMILSFLEFYMNGIILYITFEFGGCCFCCFCFDFFCFLTHYNYLEFHRVCYTYLYSLLCLSLLCSFLLLSSIPWCRHSTVYHLTHSRTSWLFLV